MPNVLLIYSEKRQTDNPAIHSWSANRITVDNNRRRPNIDT